MKRVWVIFAISIFLMINAFAFTLQSDTGEDYTSNSTTASYGMDKSAVSIFMMGRFLGNCSGVIIKIDKGYSYILTCKHCINVTEEMYVDRLKEQKVVAVFTSANDDLALLKVKGEIPDKVPAKIGLFNAKIEEKLYLVAYPNLIFKFHKVQGRVMKYTDDWGWALLPSEPGCSGGGIFNSNQELVGILWGGLGEDISLFEPVEDIWKFLKEVEAF